MREAEAVVHHVEVQQLIATVVDFVCPKINDLTRSKIGDLARAKSGVARPDQPSVMGLTPRMSPSRDPPAL